MSENANSSSVNIGNVTGGIHGSIIAGRDIKNATITLNGQSIPADKEPTIQELQQLLKEIQQGLSEIASQSEVLKGISPGTPYAVQGAEESIKDAADKIESGTKPEEAKSAQQRLAESITFLNTILDGAKSLAEKSKEAYAEMQPLIEKLAPIVTRVGVAAFWIAKIWSLAT